MRDELRRKVARTVLLVGEGDAEEALLRHLKTLYVVRGSGLVITIKNARGKGAGYVVDYAIRQSRNRAFDHVLAMFDTDTDWTDNVRSAAARGRIQTLPCEPCLEALLLQAFDHKTHGLNSLQLKQKFEREFGHPAHDDRYLRTAGVPFFNAARRRVPGIDTLLGLIAPAG